MPFKITLSEPPIAILEAMALGKPVVTTKTGCLPELVTSNRGILVEPADQQQLTHFIYVMSQNMGLAEKLGKNGKTYVEDMPGWYYLSARPLNFL